MKKIAILIASVCFSVALNAQGILGGSVSGNFQIDMQMSREDSVIGAEKVNERFLSNAFANINYNAGDFSAGFRFESYLNPILGFDKQYKGAGIPYRWASYKKDYLEVTVGNYYEQFGNGLVFRSYEERNLGLDNAMDGLKLVAKPVSGLTLKGIIGKQRYYWEEIWQTDNGLVRGLDAEVSLNELIPSFREKQTRLTVGGSFVSVYEKAETKFVTIGSDLYEMKIPENIGAAAFRLDFSHKAFGLSAEYARKGQDPNIVNNYIYRKGEALLVKANYSIKGFAVSLEAKRIDNMSFKSKRSETGNMLNVNYLPAITRQHAYSLMAMYPYATQVNGEMGIQADVMYKIKKGTWLGGKYGTDVKLNYSRVNSIHQEAIEGYELNQSGTEGYTSNFFKPGDELYFQEINLEVNKKMTKDLKMNFMYSHQIFNPIAFGHPEEEDVIADIFVVDGTYKINRKNSIRGEVQWLLTEQNYGEWAKGDWLQLTAEYNFAGKWFVALSDQWNYGNQNGEKVHYYNVSLGSTYNTTRVALSYGKQRDGIICIGGVCREVPASNGLFVTISSSF